MLLIWRKNKSTFNAFFIVYLTSSRLTLGHRQLLLPERGWRGIWKIYFPIKNGFSVKNLFWAILGPKMMDSPNSGCNVGIRANVYLCMAGLSGIFQTPLLHLLKGFLEKCYYLLKPYYMVLRLYPLIVSSS